jgi:hypothetical protein
MTPLMKAAEGGIERKGLGKRKLAVVLVLIVVVGIMVSFVSYGLAYGGLVSFTFGGKNEVRQSYQLTAMSQYRPSGIDLTHVVIRNSGGVGITVIVTLRAVNAVVSLGYYGPYGDSANVQLYLPSGGRSEAVNFYLTLPLQVPSFMIRVTVGRVLDFSSIPTLATSLLASIQPTAPTTLVYSQEPGSPIMYQLTDQY